MPENAITLSGVGRTFHEGRMVTAVHDITLEIHKGEFFVFVGLSGSGKSTLLRIMSGLDRPTSGTVRLGQGMQSSDIGFVFQQFALLPWLTVYQNIELGLVSRGMPAHERHKRVMAELETMDLSKFAQSHPRELSGGQRQRVGIARALVTEPKILFMDEPFSELDSLTAESLRAELLRLWQTRVFTVIMVTHILPDAVELADRIAVLKSGPGRIAHIFSNTMPRPREMRSAEAFAAEDILRKYLT
jgi:NitT/TauT family transport system ATP-binding protein